MKPLNSIVNIILLTMFVLLVVSGDHSIIEQDSLRFIIYFVFILFKTNISSRRANILFANSVTEPLIFLVTVQNRIDRSINSTCNKQTMGSQISISNFVLSSLEIILPHVAMLRGGERQSRNNYI